MSAPNPPRQQNRRCAVDDVELLNPVGLIVVRRKAVLRISRPTGLVHGAQLAIEADPRNQLRGPAPTRPAAIRRSARLIPCCVAGCAPRRRRSRAILTSIPVPRTSIYVGERLLLGATVQGVHHIRTT